MGPQWSGLVDMLIPIRNEIGCSKKMISEVIFGVEYPILVMKSGMFEKGMFLGYKRGYFGALIGPPMVRDGRIGRYTSPR